MGQTELAQNQKTFHKTFKTTDHRIKNNQTTTKRHKTTTRNLLLSSYFENLSNQIKCDLAWCDKVLKRAQTTKFRMLMQLGFTEEFK